ncbi:hypothetical protein JZO83_08620 [Enterococcus sp. DIV1298c]|uniref:hypothetical protein n=1 Tax=Enterococcus sp. DIV1298c TaxID=2815328 RepID=UPI001A90CD81|nr:hypothetical protein [Enterococcus sp. DIV1298c]MBO0461813.1 hypothetical protein [Enterococcus sp. DIV1298c]
MKVTEIEKVIQQVTEMLMKRLPPADYQLALTEAKAGYPQTFFADLSMVDWLEGKDPTKCDGLVVPHVSLSQLAAIAQLLPTDHQTTSILSFLFAGKPVLVLQAESANDSSKMKYHLKKKVNELAEQCERYGMYFFEQENTGYDAFLASCRKKPLAKELPSRKYVTEKQLIQRLQQTNGIDLTNQERLTPLAEEYALRNRLFK